MSNQDVTDNGERSPAAPVAPDFRRLFESAPDLYLILTPDFRIVAASDAYLQATLTRREGIVGRRLFDVFPDNPLEPDSTGVRNLTASLQRVLQTRAADRMAIQKYDIPLPDSEDGRFEERYWSPINSPVFGDDGGIMYILHKVSDVTESVRSAHREAEQMRLAEEAANRWMREEVARKAAEEHAAEIWKQREQLRVTLHSIGDGVIVTDSEGRINLLNPVAQALTGWASDEAIGLPLEEVFRIVNEEGRHSAANPVDKVLREGGIVGLANRTLLISRNGAERPIADSAAPIRDEDGKVTGVVLVFRDFSEQREAEQRLTDSEERFRAFMDNSPASAWITDIDGRILYISDSYRRTFHLPVSDPVGKTAFDIYPPTTAQSYIDNVRTVWQTGKVMEAIETGVRADGSPGEFWIFKFPLASRVGKLIGGVAIDVTEQRRAQKALHDSEERFRMLIECVKDYAIYAMDPSGIVTTWNEGAARIYGYLSHEIIGRHRNVLFTPEAVADGASVRDLEEAAANGRSSEERWRVRKDGSRFWANENLSALRDATGTLRGFVKVVRDLTERRENDEKIRLRDRAIQAVSQGILVTDPNLPDNPIIYASRGFERLTGYMAEEVFGRNCRFMYGRETDQDALNVIRNAIRNGQECSVELLNYRKDGTKFWNALTIAPVLDDDGRLLNFVGVQIDVTERRKLEQLLNQSQKMEAIGQLAGGIAHDFNNLLTIIAGYSEFLMTSMAEDDPSRTYVNAIAEAGDRASSLTRQLLAFSRQTVLEPRVLEINDVVRETEVLLRRLIGEDILLTAVLDPAVSRVKVDPGQLGQVLMNLAVNARDSMPTGGQLTIETRNSYLDREYVQQHPEAIPGRYVMLSMTDTGTGMTPEVRSRIFEPFFTTKPVGKGTGLGLAVVHGIIRQSGGFIEVYSEPGVGTSFKVLLPAVDEIKSTSAGAAPENGLNGTETILLVEDEEAVRGLALLVLQSHGYSVLPAHDGHHALRVLDKHQGAVDLLVTDVVMPGMGGRDLAEALQSRFPRMKILYSSGYTDDAVVRHGLSQENIAFLQKPYTSRALLKKVRHVLDEK